jgi:hypothetical protein
VESLRLALPRTDTETIRVTTATAATPTASPLVQGRKLATRTAGSSKITTTPPQSPNGKKKTKLKLLDTLLLVAPQRRWRIVLIQRHKAVKWAKTWCAANPSENVWEHGRFHGKCKQANNPMTETAKSVLDLSKSIPPPSAPPSDVVPISYATPAQREELKRLCDDPAVVVRWQNQCAALWAWQAARPEPAPAIPVRTCNAIDTDAQGNETCMDKQ